MKVSARVSMRQVIPVVSLLGWNAILNGLRLYRKLHLLGNDVMEARNCTWLGSYYTWGTPFQEQIFSETRAAFTWVRRERGRSVVRR